MSHAHNVYDTDAHFVIDTATRSITNQSGKLTLMQGDHNSERITFKIPRYVDGHDMSLCDTVQIHFKNTDNSTKSQSVGVYNVEDFDVCPDDDMFCTGSWLVSNYSTKYAGSLSFIMRFICSGLGAESPNVYVWSTSIYQLTIGAGISSSGGDVEMAKAEQRETDRTELAGVVTELTGEDFTAAEWNDILNATAELPIKSEQDIVDLTGYSELTNAFRQATTAPSLLTGGYNLDKDESDEDILIKLPYLYTPNAKYNENTPISSAVVECGFDVSASGDTLCHYNAVSMFNRTNSARNLRKLKLTGLECVYYGQAMFMNVPNLMELTIVEGNNYRDEYKGDYYTSFFYNCKKLEAILGTPLDMSRGTTYGFMFYNCEALRYVRFKPGTICRNLDLSYSPALFKKYEATTDNPGTLLSIINGVRDYTGAEDPITIKFSTFVKSYLSSWRCTIDEQTGLYVYSDRNSDNTMWTVLTTLKGVVIS